MILNSFPYAEVISETTYVFDTESAKHRNTISSCVLLFVKETEFVFVCKQFRKSTLKDLAPSISSAMVFLFSRFIILPKLITDKGSNKLRNNSFLLEPRCKEGCSF